MTSLDRQIADHITAHAAAKKRGDTRAVHYHRERLKDLRTKQLRRDLGWRGRLRRAWAGVVEWLAPLARIAGTFSMFLLAAIAWTLVMPIDAYASEMAPWQPSAWPLRIIAGIAALSLAAWLIGRMLNAREAPSMFDDPDKAEPRRIYPDLDSWSERK